MAELKGLTEMMGCLTIKEDEPKQLVILFDRETLKHHSTKQHPENPDRVEKILANLKDKHILQSGLVKVIDQLQPVKEQLIKDVHGQNYTQFVLNMWPEDDKRKQIYINVDTYFMKDTVRCALLAAGGVTEAVDQVLEKKHQSAFAIVRPPGHHAGMKSQPHGFCFLNNVGLGAKYAEHKYAKKRILVLDWDAHHGEGTQNLFYGSNNLLYASLHRFDEGKFFPHVKQSGPQFTGKDQGVGFNINIGWNLHKEPLQTCGDSQYVYAFERLLMPVFRSFNPDFIFISCGFDSGCGDPIGGLQLTATGYSYMTEQIKSLNVPTVVVLQGGYNYETLQWGSEAVVKSLLGQWDKSKTKELVQSYCPNRISIDAVEATLQHIGGFWPLNTSELIQLQNRKLKQLLRSIPYPTILPCTRIQTQKQKPCLKKQVMQTAPKGSKKGPLETVPTLTVPLTGTVTRSKVKLTQKQHPV